jgi:hypothetical protein
VLWRVVGRAERLWDTVAEVHEVGVRNRVVGRPDTLRVTDLVRESVAVGQEEAVL